MQLTAGDSGASYVLPLEACGPHVADLVGGKAVGLGELLRHGLPVPPGFVVTTDAYACCVADLADELSADITARIRERGLRAEVAAEIVAAYRALGDDVPVAVRSSATAEDREDASFAGQQDTYLWIVGADAVLDHVVGCWASLFTPQAIAYRDRFGVAAEAVAMAVVVQRMVPAVSAGVLMTLDPVDGDREKLYLESAFGLGESVVRGEVDVDRFVAAKGSHTTVDRHIGHKATAHCFDPAIGAVVRTAMDDPGAASLDDGQVRELAALGERIETAFGRPMDVEWAIDNERRVHLVQARPETVWSRRPTRAEVAAVTGVTDDWDPLVYASPPGIHWAVSNLGEAIPGVQTPLSLSLWVRASEHALRESAFQIGVLPASEREVPAAATDYFVRPFYGRPAIRATFFSDIGDRIPGTTGRATAESILGKVPEDMTFRPTRRRYPFVAARLPYVAATTPKAIRALARDQTDWYAATIDQVASAPFDKAMAIFGDAVARHDRALVMNAVGAFGVIQPLHDAVTRMVEAFKAGDVSTLTGVSGGAEMEVVTDIWAVSRRRLDLDTVARRHGFHGPYEGELSSRVWREDPSPLRPMVAAYRGQDDSADPEVADRRRRAERPAAEQQLVDAAPRAARPAVRLILRLARERLPLRGVCKRAFLQAFDVARAGARRVGELLCDAGILDEADDVFYLTVAELADLPPDARDLVRRRRERRRVYQAIRVPESWSGMVEPVYLYEPASATHADGAVVTGVGVSAGVVEGVARVLHEPVFADVQPGEVLVTPTTDPSWSTVMFISGALVVDIGGALSHAAVVAREMGLPCVVNTGDGTRRIRTGDRVRVDGSTGTVEILS